MRILVDSRWAGPTGIGRYYAELSSRIAAQSGVTLLTDMPWFPLAHPLAPLRLGLESLKYSHDVFWSPSFMPPAFSSKPFAFTIHDLMHLYLFDRRHAVYYNAVLRPLAHKAAYIFTVSNYTKREIAEWSSYPEDRILVTPCAVGAGFSEQGDRLTLEEPYLLYVGNRRRNKNIPLLIQAFAKSGLSSEVLLALSGAQDEETTGIATRYGLAGRIRYLGRIPENQLAEVYRGAIAFVYVSLYEGFGLPPLEAMACGTPTLVSKATSLPEVVGEAALLADPLDVEAIADSMRRIVEDEGLRRGLRHAGPKQARRYSWEQSAQTVWQTLARMAG